MRSIQLIAIIFCMCSVTTAFSATEEDKSASIGKFMFYGTNATDHSQKIIATTATPLLDISACFTIPWDSSWCHLFIENTNVYFICKDKKKFNSLNKDKAAAIYVFHSKNFSLNVKTTSLPLYTNATTLSPSAVMQFTSALDAMTQLGVKVYFITPTMFKTLTSKPNNQEKIRFLRTIKIYQNLL